MNAPVELVFDPHIRNAIQALSIAVLLLMAILFEDFIARQADKR